MLANGGGTLAASGGCVAGTAPQTTSIFSPSNGNGTTNGMTAAQAAAASVAADLASLFGTAGIPSAINCASPGSSGGGGGAGATAQLASLFDPSSAALSSHLSAAAAFNPLAGMTDAATLLQLSQLFAAQQQHSIVQQLHAVQQQHQQNIQNHQHHQSQQQQQQQLQQIQQQQQQQSIQHTNLIPQPHQQQQPQNTP
ncbi:unnamed protein product, partial [Anisakis simplex]|uniref:Uncharacterized protein n=1 Tax=Anisakis simplex TaxID=6269 RepID=A0A0M3JA42_ANISI